MAQNQILWTQEEHHQSNRYHLEYHVGNEVYVDAEHFAVEIEKTSALAIVKSLDDEFQIYTPPMWNYFRRFWTTKQRVATRSGVRYLDVTILSKLKMGLRHPNTRWLRHKLQPLLLSYLDGQGLLHDFAMT